MTTTDAVGARIERTGSVCARVGITAVSLAIALGLAGCGSSNLLGTSDTPTASAAPTTLPVQAAPVSQTRVALAPVMGAPEAVGKSVGDQLGQSLQQQRVSTAGAGDRADYTLRGYMVATRERAGTKIAYIFDLTDGAGKRVNRIQGEELAQGGSAGDPWAALSPEVTRRITDKTASSLSASLASLGPATAGSAPPPVGVGASEARPQALPTSTQSTTGSLPAQTASAPAGSIAALVPAVVGAPGDGNASLSAAMKTELQQAGVGAAASGQKAYSVAGKVAVSPPKDGKQSIKIDWRVTDPAGGLLATVSQNNEIPAGSLNGTWGPIAQEAAQGAASRIKTLIDEHRAGGGTTTGRTAARSKS